MALMEDDESGTGFQVPPGLTSVNILDYSLTRHINSKQTSTFQRRRALCKLRCLVLV